MDGAGLLWRKSGLGRFGKDSVRLEGGLGRLETNLFRHETCLFCHGKAYRWRGNSLSDPDLTFSVRERVLSGARNINAGPESTFTDPEQTTAVLDLIFPEAIWFIPRRIIFRPRGPVVPGGGVQASLRHCSGRANESFGVLSTTANDARVLPTIGRIMFTTAARHINRVIRRPIRWTFHRDRSQSTHPPTQRELIATRPQTKAASWAFAKIAHKVCAEALPRASSPSSQHERSLDCLGGIPLILAVCLDTERRPHGGTQGKNAQDTLQIRALFAAPQANLGAKSLRDVHRFRGHV